MSPAGKKHTVIIGAGPAGLTAAYVLLKRDVDVTVVEMDHQVGGIARTVEYKGFRFDIGGHRFFTKVRSVQRLWQSMLGPDMLRRPRLSRIYYGGKFFDYPLKPMNALMGLGPISSVRVLLSYLAARIRPITPEVSFEDWTTNRFGRRLYNIFFKTYTEKVWGIPCDTIGAQWAAQRIKGLSLLNAIGNALFGRFRQGPGLTTLIEEFDYPRLGPGMMWEAFRRQIDEAGGRILLNTRATAVRHAAGRVTAVEVDRGGVREELTADLLVSTMPLRTLIESLTPAPPQPVIDAARRLKYRDFLTVALVIDHPSLFPDNWIYVHDPRVKLGRIQNFKNWSPEMVPDPSKTCLGLEYFCFEGDGLWNLSERELIELGSREVESIGLLKGARVIDGTVVRQPKAYPVYDEGFVAALDVVRAYLDGFENLQAAGRNGMHKYNNQDHSMVTAILAAQNLLGESRDVWSVNADDEYHEEFESGFQDLADDLGLLDATQPIVPPGVTQT